MANMTPLTAAVLNHDSFEGMIVCLVCGDVTTHLKHVGTYMGGADKKQLMAALEFSCGSGCTFGIEIHNNDIGWTSFNPVNCRFVMS